MTGEMALRRLSKIEASDFRKLSALAAEIAGEARRPAPALLDLCAKGSETDRRKAERVLEGLRERGVGPCLEAAGAAGRGSTLDHVARAGSGYLAAQAEAVSHLADMMESKALLPATPQVGPPAEEQEPPGRECDHAYLLTRRMLKADESELVRTLTRREFLNLPREQRDREITRYRETGKWGTFVQGDPDSKDR